MVIQAQWPGASAAEVAKQVTDRIEKKLEELESLDYTKSVTTAGQTTIFVNLLPTTKAKDVPLPMAARAQHDRRHPVVVSRTASSGPFFNDRFGDVYGNIYAFTSDGLTDRQLRDQVEFARAKVLTVPNVGQVQILGARDEAIYLDFSTRKIAGARPRLSGDRRVACGRRTRSRPRARSRRGRSASSVRVDGQFTSEESLRAINLRVNDRFFPLTDVATIRRGLADPPDDAVPLQRQARHRARHRHEGGLEPARIRRGAGKEDDGDRRRPARSASASSASPTNRRSSRRRSATSPKPCSKPSASCWRSASSAWACAPASWSRSRFRWCWRSPSSSCRSAAFRCSAFRSARSSSRWGCWSTTR